MLPNLSILDSGKSSTKESIFKFAGLMLHSGARGAGAINIRRWLESL